MLGTLESGGKIVVSDLEAGVGTLTRLQPGHVDVVLVVVEPSAKSIEVAGRAADIASRSARVVVVANRVRGEVDVETIRARLGDRDLVVVPEDSSITRADRDGVAPIDAAEPGAGVRSIIELGDRLTGSAARPSS